MDMLEAQNVTELVSVIDEHQVEISEKEEANSTYMEQAALKYTDSDHQMQKYYSCPWAINTLGRQYFGTIAALMSSAESYLTHKGAYGNISYFNKKFRQYMHTTPGAYKKMMTRDNLLAE